MLARVRHFIGIAGAGMSAVAKLLRDSGVSVSGSDEGVYPPISDFLQAENLPYVVDYRAENIPPDVDIIVIGKNAKLVAATNEEVRAAYDSGKTILSFPEVLALLTEARDTAVVAGSYGKSTCAALLTHVLAEGGVDPSFFIGAIPLTPPTSSPLRARKSLRPGGRRISVLEHRPAREIFCISTEILAAHPRSRMTTSTSIQQSRIICFPLFSAASRNPPSGSSPALRGR